MCVSSRYKGALTEDQVAIKSSVGARLRTSYLYSRTKFDCPLHKKINHDGRVLGDDTTRCAPRVTEVRDVVDITEGALEG